MTFSLQTNRNELSYLLSLAFLAQSTTVISAGWSNNYNNNDYGSSVFSMQRDWLYDSSSIGLQVEGCVWGYVGEDNEDMGCMENESEDGTSMWYMMANCRRAQVAYSVYASSSGSTSCNNNDFKETFVTRGGLTEFAYTVGSYGYNAPISDDDVGDLPICDQDDDGYYLSVGCSSSGTFTIDRFSDAYCLQYYDTYDSLSDLNSIMKSLSKCYSCYDSYADEDVSYSLCAYLIPYSGSCSEIDSPVCTTNDFVKSAGSSKSFTKARKNIGNTMATEFANKLKYGMGGAMLIGSAAMFVGILFTNRRKRRAMMHRKFIQSSKKRSSKHRKSKSKSSSRNSPRYKTTGDDIDGVFA